jgi:uncharacterized membrane protein
MSTGKAYEAFVAVYDDEQEAAATLDTLKDMHRDGTIGLIDAAVLAKGADGKIKVTETAELTPGKGAKRGAVIGAIVGLIFTPSILAAGAVGAAAGALLGKITDRGLFDNTDLKQAAEELDPGSSAIFAVVEDRWVTMFQQAVEGYARLESHALSAEAAADLFVYEE